MRKDFDCIQEETYWAKVGASISLNEIWEPQSRNLWLFSVFEQFKKRFAGASILAALSVHVCALTKL